MTDIADAWAQAETSQEPAPVAPETAPATTPPDDLASMRKRQAGSEAARRKAEEKAAALQKELDALRASQPAGPADGNSEVDWLKGELAKAQEAAKSADQKAEARILDAKYPNARKELPEVTDEVRLAKFEAMLADEEVASTPAPATHNESRTTAATALPPEETYEEVKARFLAQGLPDGWG